MNFFQKDQQNYQIFFIVCLNLKVIFNNTHVKNVNLIFFNYTHQIILIKTLHTLTMFKQKNFQFVTIIIIQNIIIREFQIQNSLQNLNNSQLRHFQDELVKELSRNIMFMSYVQNKNNSFRQTFIGILNKMYNQIGRKPDFANLNERLNSLQHYQIVEDIVSNLYDRTFNNFQQKFESLKFKFTYQSLINFAKQVSKIDIKQANQCKIEQSTVQFVNSFLKQERRRSQKQSAKQKPKDKDKKDGNYSDVESFQYKSSSCESQKSQGSKAFSIREQVYFDRSNDQIDSFSSKSSFLKKQMRKEEPQKDTKKQESTDFKKLNCSEKLQQDNSRNEIKLNKNQEVVISMKISLKVDQQDNKQGGYTKASLSSLNIPRRSNDDQKNLKSYNFQAPSCFNCSEIGNNKEKNNLVYKQNNNEKQKSHNPQKNQQQFQLVG